MAVVIGINAKMYYAPLLNPATGLFWADGLDPTPTDPFPTANGALPTDTVAHSSQAMVELTNVRDANLSLEKSQADITTRGGNGWRQLVGVLKEGTSDFEMVWDKDDVGFSNFQYAFLNDKPIWVAILDGDATDATVGYRIQGLYTAFTILNFSRSEGLEEALLASVSLAPTFFAGHTPEWVDRTNT